MAALFFFTNAELCAQTCVMFIYRLEQNSGCPLHGCVFDGNGAAVVVLVLGEAEGPVMSKGSTVLEALDVATVFCPVSELEEGNLVEAISWDV